jgi:hypothetical protein
MTVFWVGTGLAVEAPMEVSMIHRPILQRLAVLFVLPGASALASQQNAVASGREARLDVRLQSLQVHVPETDRDSTEAILEATWGAGARAERRDPGQAGLVRRMTIENGVLDEVLEHGLERSEWRARALRTMPSTRHVDRAMRTHCLDSAALLARSQPNASDPSSDRLAGWFYSADDTRMWLNDVCLVGAGLMAETEARGPSVWDGLTNPVGVWIWLQSDVVKPDVTARGLQQTLYQERKRRLDRLSVERRPHRGRP